MRNQKGHDFTQWSEVGVSESRLTRDAHGLKSMLKYFGRGLVSVFIVSLFFDLYASLSSYLANG